MTVFRDAIRVLSHHRRAFVGVNVLFYGTVLGGMAVSLIVPGLHQEVVRQVSEQLEQPGAGGLISSAYDRGIPLAGLVTFLTNLLIGSIGSITLPSLLVPFSGVALVAFRALQWGLLYPPTGLGLTSLLPHYVTLIVEGQAYVLALTAAVIQGRMFLRPGSVGIASHRGGYIAGLRATARLYPLIAAILLVVAFYEAAEVILIAV